MNLGLKEKFKAALKNGKSKEVLELLQMAPKLVVREFMLN